MQIHVHLSPQERMQIYELVQAGFSQAEIGRRLGRSKATISRELRRKAVTAGYLPDLAERRYQARRQRCRRRPRLENRSLRQTVIQLLERGLFPEQIAGRLRLEQGWTLVSHETLCRFVYESPLGRQEMLYHYLCRGQGRRERASPIANGPSSKPGRWQHLSVPRPATGRPIRCSSPRGASPQCAG